MSMLRMSSNFGIELDDKFNKLKSYTYSKYIGLDANVNLPDLIICNMHATLSRQINYL